MSGHSKWHSIRHKKGREDAKRGKIFTRLIKEISIAARLGGGDPDGNPRLRTAIQAAKAANMPQDNITRAIKKGTGELEGVTYEEATFEGYGQGGTALLIHVLTDNRNRTIAELRHLLSRGGGNMAEPGAVAWAFKKTGLIIIDEKEISEDDLMEIVLEAGADDVVLEDEQVREPDPDSVPALDPVRNLLELRILCAKLRACFEIRYRKYDGPPRPSIASCSTHTTASEGHRTSISKHVLTRSASPSGRSRPGSGGGRAGWSHRWLRPGPGPRRR